MTVRALSPGEWLASFAPTELVDAISRAADEHGWRTRAIRTTEDALAGLATSGESHVGGARALIMACDDHGARFAVQLSGGRPWLARALAGGDALEVLDSFGLAENGRAQRVDVVVAGPPGDRDAMARRLGEVGLRARVIETPGAGTLGGILAAAGTDTLPLLPLRSSAGRATDRRAMRRLAWSMLGAAAAMLLVSYGLERGRTSRELARIQLARAEHAPAVRNALTARTGIEETLDLVDAMTARERAASRATAVLVEVAAAMPRDAALAQVTTSGDTVTVDGESARSGDVYAALRALPDLEQVRLAAPLRQERSAGDQVTEHFAFMATLKGRQ
ncbi:MAG: hypothetical protein H0W68_07325 [Gemmatimonadaceae bacterium]|nr:hypothetical protein [Gemmatimonadaceae bacterium]